MKQHKHNQQGLTFAELLIVTAIIALVSIISITHYEKALTSSKATEARELLRFASVGIEAYKVDQGVYPYDGFVMSGPGLPGHNYWYLGVSITTPIAYLPTKNLDDPFRMESNYPQEHDYNNIRYINVGSTWGTDFEAYSGKTTQSTFHDNILNSTGGWRLVSVGPDKTYGPSSPGWDDGTGYPSNPIPYDPTNGLQSNGDMMRTQKYTNGYYNVP